MPKARLTNGTVPLVPAPAAPTVPMVPVNIPVLIVRWSSPIPGSGYEVYRNGTWEPIDASVVRVHPRVHWEPESLPDSSTGTN